MEIKKANFAASELCHVTMIALKIAPPAVAQKARVFRLSGKSQINVPIQKIAKSKQFTPNFSSQNKKLAIATPKMTGKRVK
jgi:hypothetical protein